MKNYVVKKKIYSIGLFGNPVKHSLSPLIHNIFSKEIKINYNYNLFLCTKSNFFIEIKKFFQCGGFGCNVTVPFKKLAFHALHQYSKRAKISNSTNTLKKSIDSNILGDNTDGIGLIYDLKRLKYIKKYSKVLLLGAGGVAHSIIYHLLKEQCSVVILNRTLDKSVDLIKKFTHFGKISVFSDRLNKYEFDILINATSCGLYNQSPFFPKYVVTPKTICYDISYSRTQSLTPFLLVCKNLGSTNISDGFGMLVAQAAYSCLFWFGVLPDINKTFNKLKLMF
ncbi:shikimate dehydrogenase [Buchnera aphidicola]|uniref:shikimate dehydrogenase n=1 Tax=Buchnera aphidicola TaxID=9 RepID=UPI000A4B424A|nr:shikimate dehydrogenase [Buchnera aphidicola]